MLFVAAFVALIVVVVFVVVVLAVLIVASKLKICVARVLFVNAV